MEAKHTTGPWVIDWNVSRLDIFSSDATVLVASLRRSTLSEGIDKAALANARLIAAAPEIYAALKDLVYQVQGPDQPPWLCLKDARAAIAKAEGK